MLKVMRDSFHHLKWILLAVVAAFVFGFVFIDMGLGGALGGSQADPRAFAARVNGEVISFNEYSRFVKNLEDMYRQAYGQQFTPEMANAMGLPKQALDALVDQKLLEQEARRLNLGATPDEVRKKLLSIPTFNQDGKFVGVELYTRYVTGPLGYASAADFEEDIAREITIQKMESALMSSLIVSPKAAEAEYRRMNENARIRYVLMPSTLQLAGVTVSPAEVEAYYKAHQAEYAHGEQRQIRYLLADHSQLQNTVQPTDDELRKAYEGNRERYSQPAAAKVLHILVKVDPTATPAVDAAARAKAEGIVAQLRGGADFASLARVNSEDPSSAANGGDMGWVEMGQTVEPFEKAIFSIPLNSISDPIRSTDFGYHIVKVTERRAQTTRPFEEVRAELVNAVSRDKAQDVARNEINRIYTILRGNKPKDVKAFVALANPRAASFDSGWFAKGEPMGTLGAHRAVSEWAFSAKPGDVSEPMGTPRGPVIAYLAGVRPGGISTLADIRPRVEEAARQAKAREAAKNALAQAMAGATTIEQVSGKSGQPAQDTTVSRQGAIAGLAGDTSALVEGAIKAGVGTLQGPVTVGNGAVAFQVVEQKKITDAELAQNKTSYIDNLRGQQARSLRAVLIQRLRKGAEIEVNDEITRPTTTPAGV